MIKHKKNPFSKGKRVTLTRSSHHPKAFKNIGKGLFLGILVPVAVYHGLKHHKH